MKVVEEDICCEKSKVVIGRDAIEHLRDEVRKGRVLLIRQRAVDVKKVIEILGGDVHEVVLDGGEQDKDMGRVLSLLEYMYKLGFQRSDYVIAVGGGTLTDVAGFVSSIYMRGVKLVNIPTTLLGMVDAALGGKNAVNFQGVKNVIGTFYQPHIVIADIAFLDTLPREEYLNGLAEVIKYGVSLDQEFFEYLNTNIDKVLGKEDEVVEYIIYRSVKNKLAIVKEDPYELKGVRIVLNFGHTFGHAIEAASNFSIKHGKAVSVGMVVETMFGVDIGITKSRCVELVVDILHRYGLPTSLNELGVDIDIDKIVNAVRRDKKRYGDRVSMPILVDIGAWVRMDIPVDSVVGYLLKWIG